MYRLLLLQCVFVITLGEEQFRIVSLEQGDVKGYKYWNGDYYEFYGIPYASVPKGKDRFKGPLPPKIWIDTLEATEKQIACPQIVSIDAEETEEMVVGDEDCLVVNVFVPTKAEEEKNPLSVLVYIHGGAYSLGYGNMVSYVNLLKHDVIVVSLNYRIGALGFLCLGTEEVPGNAGLKDQVEALKWIQRNIARFNGDPNDVTIAGFTVGSSSVELLMLSEAADGLFKRAISESGSALSVWAVDVDPINTAKNIAASLGFPKVDNIKLLTEFYQTASPKLLASKSTKLWNPNSTFAFAPCVEKNFENTKSFMTESPLSILKKGKFKKVPYLTGYTNMEGLSRLNLFDEFKEKMNEDMSFFLPADLFIRNKDDRKAVIEKIKDFYFDNMEVSEETAHGFIDYFSDVMFIYSILRSAQYHAQYSENVYLYEFSYVGYLSTQYQFQHIIKGAGHRDQSSYILNFGLGYTSKPNDLTIRERLTVMWTNFVKYGDPVPTTSELLPLKWTPFTTTGPNYLSIDLNMEIKTSPLEERMRFWNEIYEKYYREPSTPQHGPMRGVKTEL